MHNYGKLKLAIRRFNAAVHYFCKRHARVPVGNIKHAASCDTAIWHITFFCDQINLANDLSTLDKPWCETSTMAVCWWLQGTHCAPVLLPFFFFFFYKSLLFSTCLIFPLVRHFLLLVASFSFFSLAAASSSCQDHTKSTTKVGGPSGCIGSS